MIFYFQHDFKVFNVKEHLAVPFVKSARGGSCVGHLLLLFTQDYLYEHSHNRTSLILLTV